jgi:zinc protease
MLATRPIARAALGILLLLPHPAGADDAAPAAVPPRRISLPYTQHTLPNGLRVVLHEDHRVPMVSVNVWYHVGSGREKPGRTGLAHLFEHLMFEGSRNVGEGDFDNLLEAAGGDNNGSTNQDRTNYFLTVPSNALELALFLESDRMGHLLDAMSPAKVDGQRDVVKNERRQSIENAPYGKVFDELPALLYPRDHPYSWETIGSMADLSAASYDDVVEFFRTYYVPGNASLVIAGDIDPARTLALVHEWFGGLEPAPRPAPVGQPPAWLDGVRQKTITDRVLLPRLHLSWLTPALYLPGDAELDVVASVLADGKSSRLYRRLVYELQIAQDVSASQQSASLGSVFGLVVTGRRIPGQSPAATVDRIRTVVDEELDRLRAEPPAPEELARAVNRIEAAYFDVLEDLTEKADLLNAGLVQAGNPDYANEDLARYRALDPQDIQAAVRAHLPPDRRVELVVEPETGVPER